MVRGIRCIYDISGALVLLSAGYRIGVEGGHRIGLNEVAIGLTVPWSGPASATGSSGSPATAASGDYAAAGAFCSAPANASDVITSENIG